jgi:hypothetical protein
MKKKRIETSKKIVLFNDILMVLCIAVCFICKFVGLDISDMTEIIVAVIGLSAVGHGFYFWKAKAENLHKYGKDENISMSDSNTYV